MLLFTVHPASTGLTVDTFPPLQVVAVIPARFASTRFPGKPLARIEGRPMIEHVYRRAEAAAVVSRVIVATDDLRIATTVNEFGGNVRLTRADHQSGTDRLAEVASTLDCDIVVNVQGDEPLLDSRAIGELIAPFSDPAIVMTTLYRRIEQAADLTNPNVVKVVLDRAGFALYFSRAAIPHTRDPRGGWPPLYRHIGLYAYRRNALLVLAALEPTPLERA
jgi:3-deoxy-manno-octulosonate cytidylyltransferase (CMP-KDO synthetase)